MSSRVFVIQRPKPDPAKDGWMPDLEPATKFGTLHYIFEAGDRPFADSNFARRRILSKLSDFEPTSDYLLDLKSGDPAAGWEVIKVLIYLRKEPRMLYWSRGRDENGKWTNDRGYYEVYDPETLDDFFQHNSGEKVINEKTKSTKAEQKRISKLIGPVA